MKSARGLQRVVVIGPSWVGDAVMATPALRLLREHLPDARIDVLTRRPVDDVLASLEFVSGIQAARPRSPAEHLRLVNTLRAQRYDAALLLSNAFKSALIAASAGIPVRVGYDRDARGWLLTRRLAAPRREGSKPWKPKWALVPAARYYLDAAAAMLGIEPPADVPMMELAISATDEAEARRLLQEAGVLRGERFVVLNPGGNNEAKRWPAERFITLGQHLQRVHGMAVLVNGSPAEAVLCGVIARGLASGPGRAVSLPALGGSVPGLKGLLARASLLVTNDTGPRHIAAAFGTPVVSLFGPTDHRWTTIPVRPLPDGTPSEVILLADPSLPEAQLANDHPERCRIDRIEVSAVVEAVDRLLEAAAMGENSGRVQGSTLDSRS